MDKQLKIKIVDHAQKWAKSNNMSQADLAKHAKINAGYISNMLRHNFTVEVDKKDVDIQDRWFYQLADATGYSVTKQYWGTVLTKEFETMIHHLNTAKSSPHVTTIINDTGLGKTYCVDKFCLVNALHTYKVTATKLHKVKSILAELAQQIGTAERHNTLDTLIGIIKRLKELKMMGHQPMIIIDEAENLSLSVIQMLKGIYDGIVDYASLVLIGTSQLTASLDNLVKSDKNGAPQFQRRIKAGIRIIPSHKDYTPFFDKFKVNDKGLRILLTNICNNYGELHDYLEPALREADESGQQLTENMFRIMYNMPNFR